MTQTINSIKKSNQPVSLVKPLLIGAATGLILISFFLLGAGEPMPEWGKLWMIKPLIMVSVAGAMGGAFYYSMAHLSYGSRLSRTVAILLSRILYLIMLWLGTVLGLNGTW